MNNEHKTTHFLEETITFLEETLQKVKDFKTKMEVKTNDHEKLMLKIIKIEDDVDKIRGAIV